MTESRFHYLALYLKTALLIVITSTSIYAGSILTVTNPNDAGPGSLRQTVIDAQPGDTIVFSAPSTIVLASEIIISKDIAIRGLGLNQTIISGNNVTRILDIRDCQVDISHLRLTNGNATELQDLQGGAMRIDSLSEVAIDACDISNNIANGILEVTGMDFSNTLFGQNSSSGGAIYNDGALTISNSSLQANSVLRGSGGGIYNSDDGILTISAMTINANTADASTAFLKASSTGFFSNELIRANGGAIYNEGVMDISQSNLTNNKSITGYGGAVYNSGKATITSSSLKSNESLTRAFYDQFTLLGLSSADVSFSIFGGQGGAIYTSGQLTTQNTQISGNYCNPDREAEDINGNMQTFVLGLFSEIDKLQGGGIYAVACDSLQLINSTITGNSLGISNLPGGLSQGTGLYIGTGTPDPIFGSTCSNPPAVSFLTNSIISVNYIYTTAAGDEAQEALLEINNNFIGVAQVVNSLVDTDPLFVQNVTKEGLSTSGDIRVTTCSPAINNGVNIANLPLTDINGDPRINESIIDIGATEFTGLQETSPPTVTAGGFPFGEKLLIPCGQEFRMPDLSEYFTIADNCDSNPSFIQSPVSDSVLAEDIHHDITIIISDVFGNSDTISSSLQLSSADIAPQNINPSDIICQTTESVSISDIQESATYSLEINGNLAVTDTAGVASGLQFDTLLMVGDTFVVFGRDTLDYGIILNGSNEDIIILHDDKLKPTQQITIDVWVKADNLTNLPFQEIYRKEDGNDRHLLSFQDNGTTLSFGLGANSLYQELDVPINLNDYEDNWIHVAATYDGGYQRLYANGVLLDSIAASGSLNNIGTAPVYIGSSSGVTEFFDGSIDDVRLWNRAISTPEMNSLRSACIDTTGLILWLDFNGANGNVIRDISGNNLDATLRSNMVSHPTPNGNYIPGARKMLSTQRIVKADDTPPVVSCIDTTLYLNSMGLIGISATDMTTIFDNCDISSLVFMDDSSISKSFSCVDTGAVTFTISATDASMNSSMCTTTITIRDTTPPSIISTDTTLFLNEMGTVSLTVEQMANITDNCDIDTAYVATNTRDCNNTGTQSELITVRDVNGNETTVMVSFQVMDTISPVIQPTDITLYLDHNGIAMISPSDVVVTSTDNCDIMDTTISKSIFNCNDLGNQNITITVRDNSNNTTTALSNIMVLDTILPTLLCRDTTIYLSSEGSKTIDANYVFTSFNDNCGIAAFSIDTREFSCDDTGDNAVIFSVSDISGNTNTCTATVTVLDTFGRSPMICIDTTVYLDGNGSVSIDSTFFLAPITSTCGEYTIQLSEDNFNCTQLGPSQVTVALMQDNMMIDMCTASITVLDTISPTAVFTDTTLNLINGTATIDSSFVVNNIADNCEIRNVTISQTSFDCTDIGMQNINVEIEDNSGNTTTQVVSVVITDNNGYCALPLCQDDNIEVTATALASQDNFVAKTAIDIGISIPAKRNISLRAPRVDFNEALSVPDSTILEVTIGGCRD